MTLSLVIVNSVREFLFWTVVIYFVITKPLHLIHTGPDSGLVQVSNNVSNAGTCALSITDAAKFPSEPPEPAHIVYNTHPEPAPAPLNLPGMHGIHTPYVCYTANTNTWY